MRRKSRYRIFTTFPLAFPSLSLSHDLQRLGSQHLESVPGKIRLLENERSLSTREKIITSI